MSGRLLAMQAGSSEELPRRAELSRQAERQFAQLEPDEQEMVLQVLDVLEPADVRRFGRPTGESPAGTVWRVHAGPVGLFVAMDEDSLLVIGFAVRRGARAWRGGGSRLGYW